MKLKTLYPVLWILPIFTLMWGIFILFYFDTFYSRNIDPEYPYLINGLNAAILKFNQIGHYDHPELLFKYSADWLYASHIYLPEKGVSHKTLSTVLIIFIFHQFIPHHSTISISLRYWLHRPKARHQ